MEASAASVSAANRQSEQRFRKLEAGTPAGFFFVGWRVTATTNFQQIKTGSLQRKQEPA
jgi:hypothetical protein